MSSANIQHLSTDHSRTLFVHGVGWDIKMYGQTNSKLFKRRHKLAVTQNAMLKLYGSLI